MSTNYSSFTKTTVTRDLLAGICAVRDLVPPRSVSHSSCHVQGHALLLLLRTLALSTGVLLQRVCLRGV